MTAGERVVAALQRGRAVALVPALSIALALVIGAVIMILSSPLVSGEFDPTLPVTAYLAMLSGAFGSFDGVVRTLVNATPLVLAGLAVGIGFKAGLFNIGAQGQFLIGALTAAAAALALNDASPFVAIPVALLAGMLGGLLWGFVPGALKAYTGAHEVVVTIMLNYVALAVLSWAVSGPLRGQNVTFARTDDLVGASLPIFLGRDGHIGLLIAAVSVPLASWLLYRSTIGFETRTTGANPDAARYAGMHPRKLIVFTMSLCGLLAGLAGASQLLGEVGYMTASFSTTVGFDAIAVALLGRAHPVGILFGALLFGAMQAGSGNMQILAGLPVQMVGVLQATILLVLTAEVVVRRLFRVQASGPELVELASVSRSYGGKGTG